MNDSDEWELSPELPPEDEPIREVGEDEVPAEDPPIEEAAPWRERLLARPFLDPLRDTRTWALLLVRGYLSVVFFQAAIGHLGVPAAVLANQWAPVGPLGGLGAAVRNNPQFFVDSVIVLELLLAIFVGLGVLTRLAGLLGLLLNAFFFAAYEWSDAGQLYLSWDASLAVLWAVVLLSAPGQYLGVASWLSRRHPRYQAWWS